MRSTTGIVRSSAAVLLLVFGWMLFAPSMVVMLFHLNRAEIIRTLCVERDKPLELNGCKGSCHLGKQLKAVQPEEEEEEQAPPRIEREEVIAVMATVRSWTAPDVKVRHYPNWSGALLIGVAVVPDPVPWRT